jgi:hypothetical protein
MKNDNSHDEYIKNIKKVLKLFGDNRKENFEITSAASYNEIINNLNDLKNNMYRVLELVLNNSIIEEINAICKELKINMTLKEYCESYKNLDSSYVAKAVSDLLLRRYFDDYCDLLGSRIIFELTSYFISIILFNFNNANQFKLLLNKDYETSESIKLYYTNDINKNKPEINIDYSKILGDDKDKCTNDNLCFIYLSKPFILYSVASETEPMRKALIIWIAYQISIRYYILNPELNPRFDLLSCMKELANRLDTYVNQANKIRKEQTCYTDKSKTVVADCITLPNLIKLEYDQIVTKTPPYNFYPFNMNSGSNTTTARV